MGFGLDASEEEDSGRHRQDHQAVEMRGTGEAINDQRIPGVPGGVRVARGATEQTEKDGDCGKVSSGEEELVKQRAVGNSAERSEDQLGAGRVDRAEIAVIDLMPGGKL